MSIIVNKHTVKKVVESEEITSVTLEVSPELAKTIGILIGSVAEHYSKEVRKEISVIYNELYEQGVVPSTRCEIVEAVGHRNPTLNIIEGY